MVFFFLFAIIIALTIVLMWLIFQKAGKPGWTCIIPIYNLIVLLQIAKKPLWWILLYCIPLVNAVIAIIVNIELARLFGKGAGFAIGLVFLPIIFMPILGYGSARYIGDTE